MTEDSGGQDERPGVDLAYGLMQGSYDLAVSRLNAVENRIQAVMVFSASFIVTVPVLVAATGNIIVLTTPLFYGAAAIAGLNLVVGTVTRASGEIKVLSINSIAERWFDLPAELFKLYAVQWAAEHFEANLKAVNKAGRFAIIMTMLFLLETALLAIWGITQIG